MPGRYARAMTIPTNGQKTIAHTLLNLQDAYSSYRHADLPDDERNQKLNEIAADYAEALVRFQSTLNGGTHIIG